MKRSKRRLRLATDSKYKSWKIAKLSQNSKKRCSRKMNRLVNFKLLMKKCSVKMQS